MRKITIAVTFLYFLFTSGQDSLLEKDFKFVSSYEESVLSDFFQGSDQEKNLVFFENLLAIDSTMNKSSAAEIKDLVNSYLSSLKGKVDSYNAKKKVKYVFKEVHNRFFKKYELNSNFSDIFRNSGAYNCVTATALYAITFDYIGIPYQIKETPTHVFLVAYPYNHNIYVETTLPGKSGSYAPSDFLIKKAVDDLVKMKMITAEHLSSVGYNKAYNDYYYGDENIERVDLVGIQYYNEAIFHLNKQKYQDAYYSMSKAKELYQNEKTKLFDEAILTLVMEETDFNILSNFEWFLKFANQTDDLDYLKYKLSNMLSNKNWSDDEMEKIEVGLKSIQNDLYQSALLELHYSYLAEKYHKFQNINGALEYATKILKLNPENLTAKNYIAINEIDRLAQKNVSEKRLMELQELVNEYPFLPEFGIYNRYQVYLYSFLVTESYSNNNAGKGSEYLFMLEETLDKNHGSTFNQQAIGNAYGAIGAYYYRKGQKEKAKTFLNRGLQHSPENDNILRKIRLIKNSY